jgi:hypothetical protein
MKIPTLDWINCLALEDGVCEHGNLEIKCIACGFFVTGSRLSTLDSPPFSVLENATYVTKIPFSYSSLLVLVLVLDGFRWSVGI